MAQRGGLKRNLIGNVGAYAVSIVAAFIVAPIVIRSLGDQRYGVWALVAQITGYYGVLDLGLRGAITHYTARSIARNDEDGLRRSIASGFWVLAGLGAIALVVGVVLAFLFPVIFRVGDVPVAPIRTAMLIMSAVIAFGLPMSTLSGALVGYERLDLVSGIEMGTSILRAVATYVAMSSGYGLISLACIQAAVALARWALTLVLLRRHLGGPIPLTPSLVRRDWIKQLGGYGGRSLVIQLSTLVVNRTDLIVIGVFLGTKWITIYTIGQMLVTYFSTAASTITHAFTPRLTHVAAREDHAELERVYILGARTSSAVIAPMAGCMFAFASVFIGLWVGDEYVAGGLRERSDVIMGVLLAAHLPRALQSISWQLLFATRNQGYLARLRVVEAAANLVLSLVLVQFYGILGVALGTLVPLAATQLFFLPRYMARTYGISLRDFFVRGVGRPVVVGVALYAVGRGLILLAPPASWTGFLWQAAVTCGVGAALIFGFVLDPQTRAGIRAKLLGAR